MSWVTHQFDDNALLIAALSKRIVSILHSAIERRGNALIAVSGGSTPTSLFDTLSRQPLDWSRVTVTLVDERWVPEVHADSNARLVKDVLLQNRAASANFVSLVSNAESPFIAESDINQRLSALALPLDVGILGMGNDGHTASFFPDADTLSTALDPESELLCCAIEPKQAPHARMTLTLPTLLHSRYLFLHIVGKEKWQVFQKAIKPEAIQALPVRAVLHQTKKLLDVYYAAR